MAQLISSPTLLAFLFLLTISQASTATKNGFSMQLVHSDSVRNPDLFANLTISQRILRQIEFSESQIHSLKSRMKILGYNTTLIRPRLLPKLTIFMVNVSIGSIRGRRNYYLHLDTGSVLTWTQCVPCNPSFPQRQPMFDPRLSPTYNYIRGNDRQCVHPYWNDHGRCFFNMEYIDHTHVSGILSTEVFNFATTTGPPQYESIPNIIFGCAHSTQITYDGEPAGIMGMANNDHSLAVQLSRHTNGRFSYCFFHPSTAEAGFLRFGNDIVMHEPVFRTPFINIHGRNGLFNLRLLDISIARNRLGINPTIFADTIIDSGVVISHLVRPAYDRVRQTLVRHFNSYGRRPINVASHDIPFDLCYRASSDNQRIWPPMTWHMGGADLVIQPSEVFVGVDVRGTSLFCLAMKPNDVMSILGIHQQRNKRFTYDLVNQALLFSAEVCTQDANIP